ncbi:LysR family transcriptional regulator [Actinomycetospora aeridis]|uniref:LysR substrate-binding domain-containing protein n=1 Tax=Actinomycetospora aeridis TaxID=3129231 RepID=A0ABU8NEI2_9PSEU
MTTTARLRAFVALADAGSVRGAAAALVVTESTVSAAVRALADEVGVALIERDGRGVRLSPAGARYADYARRILGLLDEATTAARGEADPEHGHVRLGAVTTAGEHLLPALLASFRARHPHVDVGVEVSPSAAVWSMLRHHELDVVVAGSPPGDLDARIRALRDNTLTVVGTPDTAAAFDPATATWLLRERGSGIRATLTALLEDLPDDPPRMVLGSHGATIAAARAGLGVTLVAREGVARLLAEGALVELAMPGVPIARPWHVVTHPDATASTELLVRHLLADEELGWRRA